MKNLKTYEGFFDFFKSKKSEDDKIAEGYMNRLEHLKSHLEKGGVSPYEILINTGGTEPGETYYTRYRFMFDDSPIKIAKAQADRKYTGWNLETQKDFIEQGCVKKNNSVFYLLSIDSAEETVIGSADLLEDLYELAEWCFNKNKQNIRINKIKRDINPSADLLDDDIWGDTPLDKR